MGIPNVKIGDKCVCPICGKEFEVSSDTMYIAKGGYTCSWKCFLTRVKDGEVNRNDKTK